MGGHAKRGRERVREWEVASLFFLSFLSSVFFCLLYRCCVFFFFLSSMSSAYRGFVGCAPDLFCVCVFPFSLTLKRQTKCVFFGVWNEVDWLVRKSNTTNRTTYIGLCGRNSGSSGTLAERIFLVWHALPCRLCFFFFSFFFPLYVCGMWKLGSQTACCCSVVSFFFFKIVSRVVQIVQERKEAWLILREGGERSTATTPTWNFK